MHYVICPDYYLCYQSKSSVLYLLCMSLRSLCPSKQTIYVEIYNFVLVWWNLYRCGSTAWCSEIWGVTLTCMHAWYHVFSFPHEYLSLNVDKTTTWYINFLVNFLIKYSRTYLISSLILFGDRMNFPYEFWVL
jgi:hypothetical protein